MPILTTKDTTGFNVALPASPNWTSQISYEAVASLPLKQSVCAVLMCLYGITTNYNGPLEAAHAHSDDDKGDRVE